MSELAPRSYSTVPLLSIGVAILCAALLLAQRITPDHALHRDLTVGGFAHIGIGLLGLLVACSVSFNEDRIHKRQQIHRLAFNFVTVEIIGLTLFVPLVLA